MPEPDDMERPVTRGELREELTSYPTKEDLRDALANYPTKEELDDGLAKLKTELRVEFREEFATKVDLQNMTRLLLREMETREHRMLDRMDTMFTTLRSDMATMRVELTGELAQHTRAIEESTRAQIAALDDKHADLPRRVTALEAERERR